MEKLKVVASLGSLHQDIVKEGVQYFQDIKEEALPTTK